MNSNFDLLNYLLQHRTINNFLCNYPDSEMPRVIKATLAFGVLSLEGLAGKNL